jgi:hypothetical protein
MTNEHRPWWEETVVVECSCGRSAIYAASEEELGLAGWEIHNGSWLCPHCVWERDRVKKDEER